MQLANFYGSRSGGLRTAIDRWGAGYVAAGHEVVLVVPGSGSTHGTLASGVDLITVPAPLLPATGGYRVIPPGRVTDVLAGLRPDAVEVSDRITLRTIGRWAREHDVHSTMVSHERLDRLLGMAMPVPAARRLADVANADTAATFDTVVCTTAFAAVEFTRVGAQNLRRAPLGVDLAMFAPEHADPGRFRAAGEILMVHCGRLSVEKRSGRSVAALRRLRRSGAPVRLVIAGDGPRRPALERAARGLPVTFLGHVPDRRTIASLLATADVSMAPGPHETFCLSALESLASGTPVVGSRTSAVGGVIGDEGGTVADNDDAQFAAAVSRVLDVPRASRETAARSRAARYSWSASVDTMIDVHAGAAG
ncbi:alpha-1,6-mannosyltransferase [Williamsia sterculiae]|uniref:Alpha-1,6-mannosyltransferase n=1 Tax=Williamsia sterculiae TaxID=1344003 RepID=A0A1N7DLT1_9NOCA|nr:alpha-1,6-mannosyltransferase [Williamsia sterculiae]